MIKKILVFIACVVVAFIPAAIGNLATIPNIPTWYQGLAKPPFNPPNWLFGPVWSVLYLATGLSLFLLWFSSNTSLNKRPVYILFALQAALNASWSLIFFGLHQPWLALVNIIALLSVIIYSIIHFRPFSPWASYLFIPYALWVAFATYLNLTIAWLN